MNPKKCFISEIVLSSLEEGRIPNTMLQVCISFFFSSSRFPKEAKYHNEESTNKTSQVLHEASWQKESLCLRMEEACYISSYMFSAVAGCRSVQRQQEEKYMTRLNTKNRRQVSAFDISFLKNAIMQKELCQRKIQNFLHVASMDSSSWINCTAVAHTMLFSRDPLPFLHCFSSSWTQKQFQVA